jgi:predicted dehydrogenase
MALIWPAKTHPEVVILAVAARDKTKAENFAKKHGIPKAYSESGGYQGAHFLWIVLKSYVNGCPELLDDPEVDAIYNPVSLKMLVSRHSLPTRSAIQLPNGLHFEWSMKALEAGKHVLLEKPMCNTEDETRRLLAYAKSKDLIIMEAFHYRSKLVTMLPGWIAYDSLHQVSSIYPQGERTYRQR